MKDGEEIIGSELADYLWENFDKARFDGFVQDKHLRGYIFRKNYDISQIDSAVERRQKIWR